MFDLIKFEMADYRSIINFTIFLHFMYRLCAWQIIPMTEKRLVRLRSNLTWFSMYITRSGVGVLVQWLKSKIAGSNPTLALKFQRKKNVSSPLARKDSILWGASVSRGSMLDLRPPGL